MAVLLTNETTVPSSTLSLPSCSLSVVSSPWHGSWSSGLCQLLLSIQQPAQPLLISPFPCIDLLSRYSFHHRFLVSIRIPPESSPTTTMNLRIPRAIEIMLSRHNSIFSYHDLSGHVASFQSRPIPSLALFSTSGA